VKSFSRRQEVTLPSAPTFLFVSSLHGGATALAATGEPDAAKDDPSKKE